jgi:hypothetical protein
MTEHEPADREEIVTPKRRMYRKTAEIEAHRWFKNGDHPDDHVGEMVDDPMGGPSYERLEGLVVRYFRRPEPEFAGNQHHEVCGYMWHYHGWIDDLEGGHNVCPGDWIATGVQGEHWAIKPDVFAASYEQVFP